MLLCAVCFQSGRWYGALEKDSGPDQLKTDASVEMVHATHTREVPAPDPSLVPEEKVADIITPLNVRDPSALVMGPGGSQSPPCSQQEVVAPPEPTAKVTKQKKMKDGRLLELMKKADKNGDAPKRY